MIRWWYTSSTVVAWPQILCINTPFLPCSFSLIPFSLRGLGPRSPLAGFNLSPSIQTHGGDPTEPPRVRSRSLVQRYAPRDTTTPRARARRTWWSGAGQDRLRASQGGSHFGATATRRELPSKQIPAPDLLLTPSLISIELIISISAYKFSCLLGFELPPGFPPKAPRHTCKNRLQPAAVGRS
jgi:hypothetical protein